MESLLSTVVTSALVATVAGAIINAWLDGRKSKRNTRLDALSTAVALEGYAITCANKLVDHDTAVSSEGHAGSFLGSFPQPPQLPVVSGFLGPHKATVANRIMAFHQEVDQANQEANFWWSVVGDEDAAQVAIVQQVAKVGLDSLTLASDIRAAFNLPVRNLVFGTYDVYKVLKQDQPKSPDS